MSHEGGIKSRLTCSAQVYVLPGGGTSKHKMARVLGAFGASPAALVIGAFDKAESVDCSGLE